MEQENKSITIFTPKILPHFTQSLCAIHKYVPCERQGREQGNRLCGIGVDIRALSETNKLLHNYYAQEEVQQSIISLCEAHTPLSYQTIAYRLGCRTIDKKLDRFLAIAYGKDSFTEDDKKETWYLNMVTYYGSLLYKTIEEDNLAAAEFIINNASLLSFCYDLREDILREIAVKRHLYFYYNHGKSKPDQLLEIAKLLLAKGIDPDGRQYEELPTPLINAVYYKDKDFAYQLLLNGANSDETGIDISGKKYSVVDCEPEKGWLQAIIDQVAVDKEAALNKKD